MPACQASLSITNSWSLLKLMSIESVMPSSYLILCHPLLLLPPIHPSIRVFSNESTLHMRWPKYWSFRFNITLYTTSVQFSSVTQSCLTLCDPMNHYIQGAKFYGHQSLSQFSHSVISDSLQLMNRTMPGVPVHHQLLESTQTYIH